MLFYIILLSLLLLTVNSNDENWLEKYPAAYTSRNRVMGLILAFNYDHIDPLMLIMGQYQSMCEGGWYPTVVVFTTVDWSLEMKSYIRQKTYCQRINGSVPIIVDVHPPSIGFALGTRCKISMDFCFFIVENIIIRC